MSCQTIRIDETMKAVCCAISNAESAMRDHIKIYYHDASEEFITYMFYSHIRHCLLWASQKKLIEGAFIRDLKSSLRISNCEGNRRLRQAAEGLIADIIVLHNKQQEGKTGGDFGLVISHPEIVKFDDKYLEIKKGQSCGLLCQAKLKDKGYFKPSQLTKLEKHLDYTSLVLYSYHDKERSELNPILWKLCKGCSLPAVKVFLKQDSIDQAKSTTDIIMDLGRGAIGTPDQDKIKDYIALKVPQYFEIRIYKHNDPFPGKPDQVFISQDQIEQEKNYEYNKCFRSN